MDDLTGLDWNASKQTPGQKPSSANYYPTLRPTPPISGRSTPAYPPPGSAKPSVAGAPRSNSSTPANDSFADLVSFNAPKSTKNLSLQEQQDKLAEERARQEKGLGSSINTNLGNQDAAFWENLGSGRTTPNNVTSPPRYTATTEYGGQKLSESINKPFAGIHNIASRKKQDAATNVEEDLLPGFSALSNKSKAVSQDSKSAAFTSSSSQSASSSKLTYQEPRPVADNEANDLDDDFFGLGVPSAKGSHRQKTDARDSASLDEDDILGLLGRPVSEFPPKTPGQKSEQETTSGTISHPQDSAIAELVDMGFSPEQSREALESTESGTDVQAAVGWLLNQAHQKSQTDREQQKKQKSMSQPSGQRRQSRVSGDRNVSPAWQREERQNVRRQNSRSPANGEKDPAKMAAELGNNLFKTANSLWKTGTKKLNQAVSELNSDSDSNQPKWMKDARLEPERNPARQPQRGNQSQADDRNGAVHVEQNRTRSEDVTDEALMLESGDARPSRKPGVRPRPSVPVWSNDSSRDHSPVVGFRPQARENQQSRVTQPPKPSDPKSRLNRQLVEEQTSQAYVSPARRKQAAPKPPSPEPDLLFESSQPSSRTPRPSQPPQKARQTASRSPPKSSLPVRPPAPVRNIPSISPSVLQTSNASRLQGSEAFKRGDYGQATTHYTSALATLPSNHPLTIPILTNRALSYSKTGEPKSSIADATAALKLIGPSRGASETIDHGLEGHKEMSLFWGKAMIRQAEALEQLERWSEAASVWKSCVEANVGGATSIASRDRCERAANPSKPTPAAKRPLPKPVPKQSALDALSGAAPHTQSTEAVSRLRAANLEAERVDDEKFALSDRVSERLQSWRAGKEGNLRALLGSLETVLWADAGWKKVGMGELILPGKVKVAYMKGIAKVHPDKVCWSGCWRCGKGEERREWRRWMLMRISSLYSCRLPPRQNRG